jgi:hypothetical protein
VINLKYGGVGGITEEAIRIETQTDRGKIEKRRTGEVGSLGRKEASRPGG